MYSVAEHAATQIDYALEVFDLETDRIRIVMDLQYDEVLHSPVISYNVRVVEEPREDYRIDLDYSFEDTGLNTVVSDIYPECVRTMKARFPDAQLQYQHLIDNE
jgi:GTP:adenosylcobinamide-phosphate guanylyltransferase